MLDPEKAGVWLRDHFDNLTPEQFVANVRKFNPDLAAELWGDRTAEDICGRRSRPVRSALRRFVPRLRRSPA